MKNLILEISREILAQTNHYERIHELERMIGPLVDEMYLYENKEMIDAVNNSPFPSNIFNQHKICVRVKSKKYNDPKVHSKSKFYCGHELAFSVWKTIPQNTKLGKLVIELSQLKAKEQLLCKVIKENLSMEDVVSNLMGLNEVKDILSFLE